MTLDEFKSTLIVLGFKPSRSNTVYEYETKEIEVIQYKFHDNVFIHKKYLSKRPDKEFNDLNKALKYITKSLDLDKDLF